MHELQQEQAPIDRAIVDAMIQSTPDDWSHIVLTLERPEESSQIGELSHELSSPEGYPPVAPEDSLFEATYRLDELFQRYGAVFSRAVYEVEFRDGKGKFKARFEYRAGSKVAGYVPPTDPHG